MRLLFVCTGNRCRSPIAERLAAAWARQSLAGSPEIAAVELASAGVRATPGRPIEAPSAAALRTLGGDPEDFASRLLTAELAATRDLVLTMTRDQRREVLALTPRGLRRTFTLREAAALLPLADRRGLRTMPLDVRALELARRLDDVRNLHHGGSADDIEDPMGRRTGRHVEVADMIATALRPLADILFISVRSQPVVAHLR